MADAAIDYFDRHANLSERFAGTLERLGWEDFTRTILAAYEEVHFQKTGE